MQFHLKDQISQCGWLYMHVHMQVLTHICTYLCCNTHWSRDIDTEDDQGFNTTGSSLLSVDWSWCNHKRGVILGRNFLWFQLCRIYCTTKLTLPSLHYQFSNNITVTHRRNIFTLAPVSVFSFSLERWDKMAVQSSLLHTTASPVCMWLGSVSALNLTAITLVSACLVVLPFTPPNKLTQHLYNSNIKSILNTL